MAKINCILSQTRDTSDLVRDGWVAEKKHDGTNVIVKKDQKGKISIWNRHRVDYTRRIPEFVKYAGMFKAESFTVQGEADNGSHGKLSF